jgi:hypothetical protein
MILFWLLVGALAAIVAFPETQIAATLRRSLVDAPARILREMTLRKLARGLLVILVVAIAAMVAPEMLALMMSLGDVGLAIELFAALALLAINRGVTAPLKRLALLAGRTAAHVRARVAGRAPRRQRRRTRPGKRPPTDEAGPAWARPAIA